MATNSTLNLNGRVEKTDIPTLLRSVERDKLSGELNFSRQSERIGLYFLFGQLYHAKWGDVVGLNAVNELLNWKTGIYGFTEGIIPAQATISDDIDRVLEQVEQSNKPQQRSLTPAPDKVVTMPVMADGGDFLSDLAPFDLNSLGVDLGVSAPMPAPAYNNDPVTPSPNMQSLASNSDGLAPFVSPENFNAPASSSDRVAPPPPSNGLYRTRLFCLPAGEQMATSLMATGPQLEEELLHLAQIGFTGYVLGGPEIEGFATSGICLLHGRFIHAFYLIGNNIIEGEKAYRTALDQTATSTRFYWFYELRGEVMRAAISLLTPPTRYSRLEVRILRFKELLRLLNEESHTGCVRLTISPNATMNGRPSSLAGERAYLPIYLGNIMGLWTDSNSRLTNDGQLLQRFLNEPQAYLDLHTTAPVAEPGLPLEALINYKANVAEPEMQLSAAAVAPAQVPNGNANRERETRPDLNSSLAIDDDERQIRMIGSISRMESTWTQLQMKGRMDQRTVLLTLAGFANELLSLDESVMGRRGLQDLMSRSIKQELAPFRTVFQMLDLTQGRVNMMKLLKEFELVQHDSTDASDEFYREVLRGLRTLIRACFQYYVSLIRSEAVRFECQEMYEIFLQDVVRKM